MDRAERLKLYERLYFHELDRREKISARLTLPFGAMVAVIGLLSFMLNSDKHLPPGWMRGVFWSLFAGSSIALLLGAWFFRKAWYGSTDQHIPRARILETYHAELLEYYSEYKQRSELANSAFSDQVLEYFVNTSSVNYSNNTYRTNNIYSANFCLTVAILLAFFSIIPFYVATNQPSETMTKPVQPPPPPPPPPPPVEYARDSHPKPAPSKK